MENLVRYWWVGLIAVIGYFILRDDPSPRRSSGAAVEYEEGSPVEVAPADALIAEDGSEEGEETRGGETYREFDDRRDALEGSRGSYGGYGCTVDCGGHNAGYEWAERRGIEDPDDCGGKSWSFEEGCRAYAEEQQEQRPRWEADEQQEIEGY